MSKFSKKTNKLYDKYVKEFKKKQKVAQDRSYSSYWMDESWHTKGNNSRFGGWSSDVRTTQSSDIVKMIKLSSYQRAIANFVKIVTKKEIPVVFGGNTSATNGKRVILASDISDKNFDVAVGLALHEASHILLTDFDALMNYFQVVNIQHMEFFKTIVNIIEDRRIDHHIFKSSPGYRAYYHKMYDHYFYSDMINKALVSREFRDSTLTSHWELRLANLTNPLTDLNALKGFRQVYNLIDVKNIGRLKSTQEVIALTQQVYDLVMKNMEQARKEQQASAAAGHQQSNQGSGQDGENNESKQSQEQNNKNAVNSGVDNMDSGSDDQMGGMNVNMDGSDLDGDSAAGDSAEDLPSLTSGEMMSVQRAFNKQREFLNDQIAKKKTTKKLQEDLSKVSKMGLDVQLVGDESTNTFQTIIYDLSSKMYLRQLSTLAAKYNSLKNDAEKREVLKQVDEVMKDTSYATMRTMPWHLQSSIDLPSFLRGDNSEEIAQGLELGSLLGRKLQVRNEERSLVYNRLVTGNIDSKRLAHAGYGIDTVFKQVHIDKYKQVCLHISLDLSGSMLGNKWTETVKMTTAIVKAASYVQNLRIQLTARTTDDRVGSAKKDSPVLIYCYDSNKNDLNHFLDIMKVLRPTGCTPEGLCFDALMKRNMLLPSNSECTSYFLNISDGDPGMNGLDTRTGRRITRKMVQKMKNDLGIDVISFFVEESRRGASSEPSEGFRQMYGKDSRLVAANNVTQIARELNNKFLSEGKYTA